MQFSTRSFAFARTLSSSATVAPFFQALLEMKRERERRERLANAQPSMAPPLRAA
ncbi:MAG: hypothetical protein H6713_10040 [Myxococcales bacterium]|nr:hypothetical protein [Myxococcales bacterium]MCB9750327.1 hypothetical protein [Myxococcales bacterium]